MRLRLERKAKKPTYTIGKLYVNDAYFCDTLEPRDRQLTQQMSAISIQNFKVIGKTAIPTGIYRVEMHMMMKRRCWRPQLMDVPGFSGIFIHEGNKPDETRGCILLGNNSIKGQVVNSAKYVTALKKAIEECDKRGEKVEMIIK